MEGERLRLPPILVVGCEGATMVGIEQYMQSESIEDHQIALEGLKTIARFLSQGEQLDRDPQGLYMTDHHLYGGPDNTPVLRNCELARRFYTDSRNIMRVRRDIHTFIENTWGWFPLPDVQVMYEFVKDSESNIASKTKKHIEQYVRGDCDGQCRAV